MDISSRTPSEMWALRKQIDLEAHAKDFRILCTVDMEVNLPHGRQRALSHRNVYCHHSGFEPLNTVEEPRKEVESYVGRGLFFVC